jgi:hypothetical protein
MRFKESWHEKLFWKFVVPVWTVFGSIVATLLMIIVTIYLISAIAQLIGV